jgi:uncharacterized protein with HEPN domain
MPEEERLRLLAIQERIALIRSWTDDLSEEAFISNPLVRDATALSLMVIGETSGRLLEATRNKAPEIPWISIRSLRNRIAHGYETVDHQLVWQIIRSDLPELGAAIGRLLQAA